jgi:hypothetical protein
MAGAYALSKVVYKELRDTIGPWAKAQGFARRRDTPAGWHKNLDAGRVLYFQFEMSAWGDPDIGNALNGYVQIEPQPGGITATPIRQSSFTVCLLRPELDRLAKIQGAINARRPRVPASFESDMAQDTRVGDLLRSRYDPSPAYQEGQFVPLAYYTLEDVRDFTGFIVDVLDPVLERFVEGNIPRVIDTTPPHLRSKTIARLIGRVKP